MVKNGTVRWMRRTTGGEAGRAQGAAGEPPVDCVFIDADHRYDGLRRDWEAWRGRVAPGGIVALHDSRSTPERNIEDGSVRYTRNVILKDPEFTIVETVDRLTVLRRVSA